MIHYLKGKIEFKDEKFLVIEVAGLGYKVFCSPNTLKKTSKDELVKFFTYLHLKEESIELYGFFTTEELELFEILKAISGIGPKTAMMLASLGSLEKLKEIMEKGQLPSEIKGIGKKRMQKILLELTGKIKEIEKVPKNVAADDTLDALVSLGFPRAKAKQALSQVSADVQGFDKKIKEALKILGRS